MSNSKTAKNKSSKFEEDFREWHEHAAHLLLEEDSEETKAIVREHMAEIHATLERKQKQATDKLNNDIKKEQEEIKRLKSRLIEVDSGYDQQTSVDVSTDILSRWRVLKSSDWLVVFNAYIQHSNMSVKDILHTLIVLLKMIMLACKNKKRSITEDMMFHVIYPGESRTNKKLKLPAQTDQELEDKCTDLQEKTLEMCTPSIAEHIAEEIQQDKSSRKLLQIGGKEPVDAIKKACHYYLLKCTEFCWMSCFEGIEIYLVSDPKIECDKELASQFPGRKEIPKYKYVEWPALIQDGRILQQWELYYHHKLPRPTVNIPPPPPTPEVEQEPEDNVDARHQYNMVVPGAEHNQLSVTEPRTEMSEDFVISTNLRAVDNASHDTGIPIIAEGNGENWTRGFEPKTRPTVKPKRNEPVKNQQLVEKKNTTKTKQHTSKQKGMDF